LAGDVQAIKHREQKRTKAKKKTFLLCLLMLAENYLRSHKLNKMIQRFLPELDRLSQIPCSAIITRRNRTGYIETGWLRQSCSCFALCRSMEALSDEVNRMIFLVFKSICILENPGAATWHDAIFTGEQSFARNQKPVTNLMWMKYKLGFMSTKLLL